MIKQWSSWLDLYMQVQHKHFPPELLLFYSVEELYSIMCMVFCARCSDRSGGGGVSSRGCIGSCQRGSGRGRGIDGGGLRCPSFWALRVRRRLSWCWWLPLFPSSLMLPVLSTPFSRKHFLSSTFNSEEHLGPLCGRTRLPLHVLFLRSKQCH